VERAYKPTTEFLPGDRLIMPQDIETQLADLRSLLNQIERENGLPLSCTDIELTSVVR
jgi:hypothetical protein